MKQMTHSWYYEARCLFNSKREFVHKFFVWFVWRYVDAIEAEERKTGH